MNTDGNADRAVAIVGLGAILPDAPNVPAFWNNIVNKCYSITPAPPNRWSADKFYDPDPSAPDKTYSKIGAWVQGFEFDWKRFHVPPRVAAAMDESQKWAVTIAAEALADYGYPTRPLDTERVGIILGTAMGGEMHYLTHLRIAFPEFREALTSVGEFRQLPAETQRAILARWHETIDQSYPPVTEDSMPGELANIVSGRVANLLNLRGPNYITDAACAATLAAVSAAMDLLFTPSPGRPVVDAVLTGGVDHNMSPSSFVKFSKIGALSATGSRPFAEGADGFVMGEGAAVMLLKRLADAERDGDKVYAVIRGIGGSSDGKGKGITAPNPFGQQLAIRRAWQNAGLDPATATLIEAHGTSTRVGDVAEVESLSTVFGGAPRQSIALGSVKSNIGHLKAGAGAAGLLKATLALYHKVLPPTLNADRPNSYIDFRSSPLRLNTELGEWPAPGGAPRRCGVSAYGFGGTNFHAVLEEYVPGALKQERKVHAGVSFDQPAPASPAIPAGGQTPLRGILALGGPDVAALRDRAMAALKQVQSGWLPPQALPTRADLAHAQRLVIDFGGQGELLDRLGKALKALESDAPAAWKALQAQGIFRGQGERPGKIAFLFPGQGSQYLNMGRELARVSPLVSAVFAEADRVMEPILDRPLTGYLFLDASDPQVMGAAEHALMQTAITQPAVLTMDTAVSRLLAEYGFAPDMVMGHSLGEYAALIAASSMPFADALEASAARGREMTRVSLADNGWMAAVIAPLAVIQDTLAKIDGYVVAANINSSKQAVIGGESAAVKRAMQVFEAQGYEAKRIPVSHAFHTRIVERASGPLRQVLDRLHVSPPRLPVVSNVTGDWYPTQPDEIRGMLQLQVASPVQWVKGLETLYAAGARAFVEIGPKKALKGFVDDVLGDQQGVVSLFTNHPKIGELASFNQALCGLYAAGFGARQEQIPTMEISMNKNFALPSNDDGRGNGQGNGSGHGNGHEPISMVAPDAWQQLLAQALQGAAGARKPYDRNDQPLGSVVVSGTGLGLPGSDKAVMDPDNAMRILRGEQFIDLIPERFRKRMLDKNITRLVKGEDGSGRFDVIADPDAVIKLAGRPGRFDLAQEYGVPDKLVEALDITSQLAMAAGLDALREAGIPLVQTYRKTNSGKYLPDRWLLPEALRDETGVIFASAFPGGDRFADELRRYFTWQEQQDQLTLLQDLRLYTQDPATLSEINRRIAMIRQEVEQHPYEFDRRFLFRVLSMGHSQFAEYIGARGPNTQINAACASTTQAIGLAEDWIRGGRCRRVIVIAADSVTSDGLLEWVSSGFLATGAAATDDRVDEAALPFDRRRHGTIIGMGACALVVESEDAIRERGMRGVVELLASEVNNSAFHGTRLDVDHISQVMENLMVSAERRFGLQRHAIASQTVFVSHETFTPARGGSASAEVAALRRTFGSSAGEIVMANTKGFTGHPMGVGIEDVIAINILDHGIVPPVPNYREVDPDLGEINISRGGRYPVQYALHLAAGFGSQIAMTLTRRIPGGPDRVSDKARYARWVSDVSGCDRAELEVIKRVLRVRAAGVPQRPPMPSSWCMGTGPALRTQVSASAPVLERPARYVMPEPIVVGQPAGKIEPAPAPVQVKAVVEPTPVAEPASPPPSAPVATAAPRSSDPVADQVLNIVATKTGYPQDMLDLDLDLEADLGVDTVKQAETFVAIREAFSIPRREDLKLRDYPTLARVIQFVHDSRPDLAAPPEEFAGGGLAPAPEQGMPPNKNASPAAAPAPAAPRSSDPVADQVLNIVATKTGYPQDMLDLDLDLEADLGVDTVKQAETFVAIREAFSIPRREDLKLRDYPTLARVIQFVHDSRPDLAAPPPAVAAPAAASPSPEPVPPLAPFPRRVPVPVLRPPLDLCKPTGVTLDEHSRVIVMLDQGGVGLEIVFQLQQRGVTVLGIEPGTLPETIAEMIQAWQASGPVQGVYWLAALDAEPDLEEMDLAAWRDLNRTRVKNLYLTMRALYESVSSPGTFLVAATAMGGLHGYGPAGAAAPLGGAVTGFAKAYKREQPGVLVKAVDVLDGDEHEPVRAVAALLVGETLADPGVVEVGYRDGLRYTVTLAEQPADDGQPGMALTPESVFLVTGAAGGITSAIVADLAAASAGTFYLMDLAPAPDPDSADIRLFRTDREALKAKLIDDARQRGERPAPTQIDKALLAVERQEAALRAVQAVQSSGGQAHYISANLLDAAAVQAAVDGIRDKHGRIDVLVHAAGIEISRALPAKDPAQFDLVFDVKADGLFNLLRAARGLPIGAIVSFSSVAGRFGNSGQTDYAAANDLLCKISSSLRHWRPDTRGIAIDWTAWSGIGMATRGSIPKIMEAAGIDMLPPEWGVPTVRRELTIGGTRGEIIVGGRLGILTEEWDNTGGLDADKVAAALAARPRPMIGNVQAARLFGGLEVETTLDPRHEPFLRDHQMDSTPLLPGVMGVEAFAELAGLLAPGYQVEAVENVHFEAPFKFYRQQPRTLYLSTTVHPAGEDSHKLVAHAVLKSVTPPPANVPSDTPLQPQVKVHFTADIRLARENGPLPAAQRPDLERLPYHASDIYSIYFHGPTYRVLECAGVQDDRAIGLMAAGLPPDSASGAEWEMEPRLIELVFQTAGIWQIATRSVMALPAGAAAVRTVRPAAAAQGRRLYAVVTARQEGACFDAQVVDDAGNVYVQVNGYRTVPLPGYAALPENYD